MSKADSQEPTGKRAEKPRQIPTSGWKEVFLRVKERIAKDHLQVVAAGVAFYFFLALFPAITALLSIYGLVMDPAQVDQQMSQLVTVLPERAHELITGILKRMTNQTGQSLGWSVGLGILISLYSAKKGIAAIFEGVNVAYEEVDERSFLRKNGLQLLFTLGIIVVGILCLLLIAAFPAIGDRLGLPSAVQTLINYSRWLVLALVVVFSLSLIYRVAPDRDNPRFRWVSWGSGISTLLWIGASLLFSWYVQSFGSFGETYGSFAAVIILMLWFFITAFIILLGAKINAELEHQTTHDTTIGEQKPMGQRGAYHADHLARE